MKLNRIVIILLFGVLIIGCTQEISETKITSKPVFIVYGDSRDNKYIHRIIVSHILEHNPDFVLHTGDMVNSGSSKKEWNTYLQITEIIHDILYPTPGNHEKPFDTYLEIYSNLYTNTTYYSFDKNNAHIISLDTNTYFSPNSTQYKWLINDLENINSKWKFVFFHHPPYSSGSHGQNKKVKEALVPVFEKYNIDIIFSGHDHIYERTFPISKDKINETGIVYIVTGGGGAPLYDINENWWTAKILKTNNFVKVEIFEDSLDLTAYNINNKEIDEYRIKK